jgi:gliding motility-associated-like protein
VLGPSPRFVILEDTFGCAPFTVKLRNDTQKQLINWIWQFNDGAGNSYSTTMDTNMSFTYQQPGVYRIDLIGEDRIYNPTTHSYSYCSEKFPYLENPGDFHPRQVTVVKTDTILIDIPDSVCVDEEFTAEAKGSNQVNLVTWMWGDTASEQLPYPVTARHRYDTAGYYTIRIAPVITSKDQCAVGSERLIRAQYPMADFIYDSTSYPLFTFENRSSGAMRYLWDFGQSSSPDNTSTEVHPKHHYGPENKRFTVCLMAFDGLDCMDSVCKELPVRSLVRIPNVFTPDNADGKNDAFDIEIMGWDKYELYIYNRWGTLVFEGHTDGMGNDGINWNGNDKNTGDPCPEGVYYVIFKYRLFVPSSDEVYHGTVTLIRH